MLRSLLPKYFRQSSSSSASSSNATPMLFATAATCTVAALNMTSSATTTLASPSQNDIIDTNASMVANSADESVTSKDSKSYYSRHLSSLSEAAASFTPDLMFDKKQQSTNKSSPVLQQDASSNSMDPLLTCLPASVAMAALMAPSWLKRSSGASGLTPSRASPVLLALAAAAAAASTQHATPTLPPLVTTTSAEARKFVVGTDIGSPLVAQDVLLPAVQQALDKIRGSSKSRLKTRQTTQELLQKLQHSCATEEKATLTLTGYKGGAVADQINQDRALVVSPFLSGKNPTNDLEAHRLLGIFDGHATAGEHVAEYCMTQLPKVLAAKLAERLTVDLSDEQFDSIVSTSLEETFVHLDKTAPTGDHGGCTASVVLQLGKKLYIANTGDSRSFICLHHSRSNETEVVYITREDKPDLPDERERVERMGGTVWVPAGYGNARVLFIDPLSGEQAGIAMSRSIGDRDIGKYGVIPNPIVDVLDLEELIREKLRERRERERASTESGGWSGWWNRWMGNGEADEREDEPVPDLDLDDDDDDVHIFAVAASDGMMDILNPHGIAKYLASSLCEEGGEHLLGACEKLITTAAEGWKRASADGLYRDDIAISVSKLRTPPVNKNKKTGAAKQ